MKNIKEKEVLKLKLKLKCEGCVINKTCLEHGAKEVCMKVINGDFISNTGLYENHSTPAVQKRLGTNEYKDLKDMELVYRYKFLFDQWAVEELIKRSDKTLHHYLNANYSNPYISMEDVHEVFNTLSFELLDKYRDDNGCSYNSFLSFAMKRALIRVADKNKKRFANLTGDKDLVISDDRSYVNPEKALMLSEDFKYAKKIYNTLSNIQKVLLDNRICRTKSYDDIGKLFNISSNTVYSEARKLTRILKKHKTK